MLPYSHHCSPDSESPHVVAAFRWLTRSCTARRSLAGTLTRSFGGSRAGRATPEPAVGPTLSSRLSCRHKQ